MSNVTYTAKFIETETVDGDTRNWFTVDGSEYAITSGGRLLDADGVPLHDDDAETQAIRRAIEAVRG